MAININQTGKKRKTATANEMYGKVIYIINVPEVIVRGE